MNDAARKNLSEALVSARLHKGYTQSELAALLCISRKALSDYECGINIPPIDRLSDLIRILDDRHLQAVILDILNIKEDKRYDL